MNKSIIIFDKVLSTLNEMCNKFDDKSVNVSYLGTFDNDTMNYSFINDLESPEQDLELYKRNDYTALDIMSGIRCCNTKDKESSMISISKYSRNGKTVVILYNKLGLRQIKLFNDNGETEYVKFDDVNTLTEEFLFQLNLSYNIFSLIDIETFKHIIKNISKDKLNSKYVIWVNPEADYDYFMSEFDKFKNHLSDKISYNYKKGI